MIIDAMAPVLLGLGLLVAPGALMIRALGGRLPVLWGAAAPVTVLMAVVLGAVLHGLHVPWRASTAGIAFAVTVAVTIAVRIGVDRNRRGARREGPLGSADAGHRAVRPSPRDRLSSRRAVMIVAPSAAAFGIGALIAISALRGMGSIATLNGSYDSFFHIAAIAFIRADANAFLPQALEGIYGEPTFYPAGWDILAALLPYDTVTTANAMTLAIIIATPASLAAMVGMMLPPNENALRQSLLVTVSSLCAPMFMSFAVVVLVMGLWPFALGALCLPPALGGLWLIARTIRSRPVPLRHLCVPVLLIVGALVAHPTNAFQLILVAVAAAIVRMLGALRTPVRRHRGAAGLVLLAVAGGGYGVISTVLLKKMDLTLYVRWPWFAQLASILMDRPRVAILPVEPWALAVVWLLAFIGAAAGLRRASFSIRMLSVLLVMVIGLSLVTNVSVSWVRLWVSPWYGARERLAPLFMCALVAIAVFGLGTLLDARSRLGAHASRFAALGTAWAAPLAVVLIVATALTSAVEPRRFPFIGSLSYTAYGIQLQPYVLPAEREFIVREAHRLPPGSVVIGNPRDGAPLFWSLGGVTTVFPTLAQPQTLDSRRVARYAHQAATDAKVCMSWHKVGATHLYVDTSENSGASIAGGPSILWEGLEKIPSDRLELVAQEGPYALYRIKPLC